MKFSYVFQTEMPARVRFINKIPRVSAKALGFSQSVVQAKCDSSRRWKCSIGNSSSYPLYIPTSFLWKCKWVSVYKGGWFASGLPCDSCCLSVLTCKLHQLHFARILIHTTLGRPACLPDWLSHMMACIYPLFRLKIMNDTHANRASCCAR